jgi:protein-L-isoaspartate(D-aspartate) O-methyltransferase
MRKAAMNSVFAFVTIGVLHLLHAPAGAAPSAEELLARSRAAMVADQLRARGIRDEKVLDAMYEIPRHLFVPEALRARAYDDSPLPIGHDQTISQPYVVAAMTEALRLRGGERVLEIGTGSGYQAAVLARLAGEVYTIEIVPELARRAAATLASLSFAAVEVKAGDGWHGWPEKAPFDAIMVTAAPEDVPPALKQQLKPGGRLVVPLGPAGDQRLVVFHKTGSGLKEEVLFPVRFVPFTREKN